MAFLNALGRVSRRGQWRLRRIMRAALPDGRLDLTDSGLIDFSSASLIRLTVSARAPELCRGGPHWNGCWHGPEPVLSASTADGALFVSNPGILEAVFPDGWSACVPPGLYDVRVLLTVGSETAEIFDEPVEIL